MLGLRARARAEFKAFAFKGNLIDLAVAVVIGTAFAAVVGSLVKDVIMPLVSYVAPGEESYRDWTLGRLRIGAFLGEVLNFLVIAGAVFLVIVKLLGSVMPRATPPPPGEVPRPREAVLPGVPRGELGGPGEGRRTSGIRTMGIRGTRSLGDPPDGMELAFAVPTWSG